MKRTYLLFLMFSAASLLAAPFFGAQTLAPADLFGGTADGAARILLELRIPRVLLGWTTGATLAVCGLIFQALFRNPLASPDMLGVSAGAAFGAVCYIRMGFAFTALGGLFSGISAAAFLGALAAVGALYGGAEMKRGGYAPAALLLAGVALNFLFAGMNMILQYGGGFTDSFRMMRWTMGGLQTVGYTAAAAALPGLSVILPAGWAAGPQLDLLVCGEDIAQGRGVSILFLRRALFAAVSLAVGISVALCGPIGFVGLMCPHICRRLAGPSHRELSVLCALFGGGFLVLCDTAARTLWAPTELPVGVITSSLGALFFLWLLIRENSADV